MGVCGAYLTLLPEDARQRRHDLRASYDALRWIVRAGAAWRLLPSDSPPWHAAYSQARRWLAAGCLEAMAHDLRAALRLAEGRAAEPRAAIPDSRTLRTTPESGARAGYDGAKRQKDSRLHAAVDTLGHLLALHVTSADAQDRAQVGQLAAALQEITSEAVNLAYVDQGYTGEAPAEDAKAHGISLGVVEPPEANRGFVLLLRWWIVGRSFAWAARFRRLARDHERPPQTAAGLLFVAFATLMLAKATALFRLVDAPHATKFRKNTKAACLKLCIADSELCERSICDDPSTRLDALGERRGRRRPPCCERCLHPGP